MHNPAPSPSAASRYPLASSISLTYCVSYWLTLQPRVSRRQVRRSVGWVIGCSDSFPSGVDPASIIRPADSPHHCYNTRSRLHRDHGADFMTAMTLTEKILA